MTSNPLHLALTPINFDGDDFAKEPNAYDRHVALPALAKYLLGLTPAEWPNAKAKKRAVRLAIEYLPSLRYRCQQEKE